MNTQDLIDHLDQVNFFENGIGIPVSATGRYSQYRVAITLVMSTMRNLKIVFDHLDLNDPLMFPKYDDLYRVTAYFDGDEEVFHQETDTMSSDDMRMAVQTVLSQLGDPLVDSVLFD